MPNHECSEKERIQKQGEDVAVIKASATTIEAAVIKISGDMQSFIQESREHRGASDEKMNRLGKDVDVLFQENRKLRDEKLPEMNQAIANVRSSFEKFKANYDGGISTWKSIPMVISLLLGVLSVMAHLGKWVAKLAP